MNEALQRQLLEVIARDLPAQMSGVLKEELTALGKLRQQNTEQLELLKQHAGRIAELEERVMHLGQEQKNVQQREAAVAAREIAVRDREHKCEMLEQAEKLHREVRSEFKEVLLTAFRGPVVHRSGHMPVTVPGMPATGNPPPYRDATPPFVTTGSFSETQTSG